MWSTIITVVLSIIGFFIERAGDKKEMSKLMFEWLKKHRLTDFVKSFIDAENQNDELNKIPFKETGADEVKRPILEG